MSMLLTVALPDRAEVTVKASSPITCSRTGSLLCRDVDHQLGRLVRAAWVFWSSGNNLTIGTDNFVLGNIARRPFSEPVA